MALRAATAILLVVVAAACGGGRGWDAAGPSDGEEAAPSLWPADPGGIAVIANGDGIAATDGTTVVPLTTLPGSAVATSAGAGDLVALNADGVLVAVDLVTGGVSRTTCAGCRGVAVVDGQVVSVDESFTMLVYDDDLSLRATVPIERVTEPRTADFPPDPQIPTVNGALDGAVAVSYLSSNGAVRAGPMVVGLYTLEGVLARTWTVDGVVYSVAASTSGGQLALGVGGSGGACYTLSVPVVVDLDEAQPVPLLPEAEHEHPNGMLYFAQDLWWNGAEIVTFGYFSGNATSGCIIEPVLRRFEARGEVAAVEIRAVAQYRFMGSGCERALIADRSGETPVLVAVEPEGSREIPGYDSIVWSAPRIETCTAFPGLGGP